MKEIKVKRVTNKKAEVLNYLKFIGMAEQFKTIYRNSDTGRITTKGYADRNPKTTEKERVRI